MTTFVPQPLRTYFRLAFGLTWGIGVACLLASWLWKTSALTVSNPLFFLAACGPSVAGLFLTWRLDGRTGLTTLLKRAIPVFQRFHWYVAVIAGYVALALIVRAATGGADLPSWRNLLYLLSIGLFTDAGPLGEEFGWRGFALPRMLKLWNPLVATLLLGAIWTLWHVPTFFIPTLPQSRSSFVFFVLGTFALAVTQTWLYLRSNGDLFLMMLIHLMANFCIGNLGVSYGGFIVGETAIAAVIVACGGLKVLEEAQKTGGETS